MFGGADHGAEHELEDGLLAEGVGDDLQASSLLEEQRSRRLVVRIARRFGDSDLAHLSVVLVSITGWPV